jgi:hypothetical protein
MHVSTFDDAELPVTEQPPLFYQSLKLVCAFRTMVSNGFMVMTDDNEDDTGVWSTQRIMTERTKSKYRNVNVSHRQVSRTTKFSCSVLGKKMFSGKVFGCLSVLRQC